MTGKTIVITADSPLSAVDHLLREIIPTTPPAGRELESFLLGYSVERAGIPVMAMAAIDEIHALAADHDAIVIGCDVSGLQETDEGHRIWGTIECVETGSARVQATRVDTVRLEHLDRSIWQLTASTILKETS